MIALSRPLFYSLFIHVALVAVFMFALTHNPKKEIKTSLKLKMISLASPHNPSLATKLTAPQPQEPIKSLPLQKTTPVIPTPVIQKTFTPLSTPQTAPTLIPQPMARPNVTPPATPLSQPIETPKVTHLPIAPKVNIEKEFLDAHLGEIRALLIQNLRYPKNAQRLKMQGEVRIAFRLKSDGNVDNVEVIQSSGFEILDEDAKMLIKNTASQFPKPTKNINLSIPLSYLLR